MALVYKAIFGALDAVPDSGPLFAVVFPWNFLRVTTMVPFRIEYVG